MVGEDNLFKDYDEYINIQRRKALKTKGRTVRYVNRRKWIYSKMLEHNIVGKTMLCVGARDDSELNFFEEKDYITEGLDLFATEKIIECDMSKIHEHSYFKNQKYDIVFSNESLEHCLDLDGFVKGLSLVCSKYFVCMVPNLEWPPNRWDCARHSFMGEDLNNDERILECFGEFKIVINEAHKNGKRLFFILEKNMDYKDNIENIMLIEPIKRVFTNHRIDFFKYLPMNATCAEIGCYGGRFTWQILTYADPKKLYVIDPYWKKYGDIFWNNKETRALFDRAIYRIQKSNKLDRVSFIIDSDTNFLPDLKDNLFDWVYLDSTHVYEDTLLELDLIKNKIKTNGLMCGHDYMEKSTHRHFGVARAITEWLHKNDDFEFCLLDNHCQWIIRRKSVK